MSAKTERPQVRTAQDLERKYNFASYEKNIKMTETGLVEVRNDLYNLVNVTLPNVEQQIDGKVETFFYSGVPTLSNLPASGWTADEYTHHVGDLYYDKSTGKTYMFTYENSIYSWENIEDDDIATALSTANAAQSTADSKIRVFQVEPTTPYDNGDLWLNDGELYVCQISRATGAFDSDDFILATDYVDGTQAQATEDALIVLQGKVTTITQNSFQQTDIESIIEGNGFKYVLTEDATYQSGTAYYEYIPLYNEGSLIGNPGGNTYRPLVEGQDYNNGDPITGDVYVRQTLKVQQVQHMYGTFDSNGMTYEKTNAVTKSNINEKGLTIKDNANNELLFAGYVDNNRFGNLYQNKTIVYTKNLITEGYTAMSGVARFEKFQDSNNGVDYPEGLGVFIL